MGANSGKTVSSEEDSPAITSTSDHEPARNRRRLARKSKPYKLSAEDRRSRFSSLEAESLKRRSEDFRDDIKEYVESMSKLPESFQSDIKTYIARSTNVSEHSQEDTLEYISAVSSLPAHLREDVKEYVARITSEKGNLGENSKSPNGTIKTPDDASMSLVESSNETAMDTTVSYHDAVDESMGNVDLVDRTPPMEVRRAPILDSIDFNNFDDSNDSHIGALEVSAARILVSMGNRSYWHFFHKSLLSHRAALGSAESTITSTTMRLADEQPNRAGAVVNKEDESHQQPEHNTIVVTSAVETPMDNLNIDAEKLGKPAAQKESQNAEKTVSCTKCTEASASGSKAPINKNKRKRQEKSDAGEKEETDRNQRVLRKRPRLEPEASTSSKNNLKNLEISVGWSNIPTKKKNGKTEKESKSQKIDSTLQRTDSQCKRPAAKSKTESEPKKGSGKPKKPTKKPRKSIQKSKKTGKNPNRTDMKLKKTNEKPKNVQAVRQKTSNQPNIDQPCRRSARKVRSAFKSSTK